MTAITSENTQSLTAPIPTRFFQGEDEILREAGRNTGLSRSEIIRRAVRLLGRQKRVVNSYNFLADLTRSAA